MNDWEDQVNLHYLHLSVSLYLLPSRLSRLYPLHTTPYHFLLFQVLALDFMCIYTHSDDPFSSFTFLGSWQLAWWSSIGRPFV